MTGPRTVACPHRRHPFRRRLFHTDNPLCPQHASLWVYGSINDIDADDVRRVWIRIFPEYHAGHLVEVVLDELGEAPDDGHDPPTG